MKIAFTSCAALQEFAVQPVWSLIQAENPDLLLLLGDNVYLDFLGEAKPLSEDHFVAELEQRYLHQLNEPNFKSLLSHVPRWTAIWDDHDFAWNNSYGTEVSDGRKTRSRQLFHKYMAGTENTNRPEVYHAFEIPPAKFIMLDNRFYRQPPGAHATILGQAQEQWLVNQLNHQQPVTVICAGSTLTQGPERWKKYKDYYNRFLGQVAGKKVLFLAGDIHENDFNSVSNIFEIIASGAARYSFGGILGHLFPNTKRQNYGILELADNKIKCRLIGLGAVAEHTIDIDSWSEVP